jgi:hypothetical protein
MDKENAVPGLTNASGSLERVPVRTRGSDITRSAWRLVAVSDEGPGTITLVELSSGDAFYRGDGVFLGWSRDDLERAWAELARTPDEPDPPMPQLG